MAASGDGKEAANGNEERGVASGGKDKWGGNSASCGDDGVRIDWESWGLEPMFFFQGK